MRDQEKWVQTIQTVASELNYEIEDSENQKFYIYIDRWNAVAYRVWDNKSSGYVEVAQWEGSSEKDSTYGRCVYSLRTFSDVSHFCNILISSAAIRARRQNN